MFIFSLRRSFAGFLLILVSFLMIGGTDAVAARAPLISDIVVRGQQKIEKAAILAQLSLRQGRRFNLKFIRQDIQSLFETGYFYDVKVERQKRGNKIRLIYTVVEKPSVASVVFRGQSEMDREELLEASSLKNLRFLDPIKLQEAAEKIRKEYEDKGFFLADVQYEVKNLTSDSVQVTYDITENSEIKVRKISILGNEKISDSKIKSMMETQEKTFFSFLSGAGSYKQEAFDRDLQRIRFLYFVDGYIQAVVERPEIYITPDKKGIYITLRVREGEQFFPGEVDFSGDLLFDREELLKSVRIGEAEVFSYQTLQEDISRLTAKYGDKGYAFTNVIPQTIPREGNKVDVTFDIEKGNKVYFGDINILGNRHTRDKVIRRELKFAEGDLYHETSKRDSVANIRRLGFFENVDLRTSTPESDSEKLNVEVEVKERNTGTLNIGAGYGSSSGFQFNAQVNETNFLGRGQNLGLSIQSNSENSTYNLNFTEPYFLDTQWSLGTDIYRTDSRSQSLDYQRRTTGGALRFGHPLGEFWLGEARLKTDETLLKGNDDLDKDIYPIDEPGQQGRTNSVMFTLAYDKRNDRFSPSKGYYFRTSLEYAGLGGDLNYTLGRNTFRYYKNIFWKVVWRNNLSYSFIHSHSGHPVPFSKRFLLGGPFSLKGYDYGQVGQRKFSNQYFNNRLDDIREAQGREPTAEETEKARTSSFRPFGGTQELYYNMEFEWPLIEEAGMKGILFYDIGIAEDHLSLDDLLADWGFGVRWFSPIGPLRFELGFPLDRNADYHREQVFNFTIGSPF